MDDLGRLDVMDNEWQAWQNVVREFNTLPSGVDLTINDPEADRFVRAVHVWGELLHELRATQDDAMQERARVEAITAYLGAPR